MPDKSDFRRLMVGLFLAALAGCSAPSLDRIYTESVKTSAVVRAAHIHPLLAIPADRPTVDVVTWTTQPTAQKYYPFGKTSVGVDVWVTLSPQIKQLCTAYSKDPKALRLRLQQLLGLPPDAARLGYTFDWNPETPRYGATEYVLRKGLSVTVKTRTSTAGYCQ